MLCYKTFQTRGTIRTFIRGLLRSPNITINERTLFFPTEHFQNNFKKIIHTANKIQKCKSNATQPECSKSVPTFQTSYINPPTANVTPRYSLKVPAGKNRVAPNRQVLIFGDTGLSVYELGSTYKKAGTELYRTARWIFQGYSSHAF